MQYDKTEILIERMEKAFGTKVIFHNFSLEVAKGEFVAVTGPSGCGKSTLLNIIGLLEDYDGGNIIIGGKKVPGISTGRATKIRRKKINYLFQSYALINDMSVMQNLLVAMYYSGITKREQISRAEQTLKQVGIYGLRNEKVNTLSGGEQQRVAIARCILKEGDLVLADEPTGALDAETEMHVFRLIVDSIREHRKTLVMVTHNAELARHADRVIELNGMK